MDKASTLPDKANVQTYPPANLIPYYYSMGDLLLADLELNPPASVEMLQVYGTSSSSIKVSWRLLTSAEAKNANSNTKNNKVAGPKGDDGGDENGNLVAASSVDGFYILYRSCVGECFFALFLGPLKANFGPEICLRPIQRL